MIEYLCRHLQTKAFVVTEIEDKRRVPAGELGEDVYKRQGYAGYMVQFCALAILNTWLAT